MAGDDRLELEHRPSDWQVGDTLVIAGTGFDEDDDGQVDYDGDEVRTIAGIQQGKITLDRPLEKNHRLPRHTKAGLTLKVYVANLTRNVVVETAEGKRRAAPSGGYVCEYRAHNRGGKWVKSSQESPEYACNLAYEACRMHKVKVSKGDTPHQDCYNYTSNQYDTKTRGHVMFMHTNFLDVNYTAFNHLGRTNKLQPLDETTADDNGNINKIGTNNRARYSVHFHRAGAFAAPGLIKGSVVTYGSGWGFVNHGSFAHMTDNVVYDVPGAGFVAERGDERGSLINNLAIKLHGTGDPSLAFHPRDDLQDHGYGGHGVWLQSPLLEVRDNIVISAKSNAYGVWFKEFDGVSSIPYEYIPNYQRNYYMKGDAELARRLAINVFKDNKAYGCRAGIGTGVTHPMRGWVQEYSIYENFLGVNTQILIEVTYSNGHRFKNLVGINNIDSPWGFGPYIYHQGYYQFIDSHFEGYMVGLKPSMTTSKNIIKNSYFNNVLGVYLAFDPARTNGRLRLINNTFGTLSQSALQKGLERLNSKNYTVTPSKKGTFHVYFYQPVKFKGGQYNYKHNNLNKQYNYVLFQDFTLNNHRASYQFLPRELVMQTDGESYEVFNKREQHPDFIPFPSEFVSSAPKELNMSKWMNEVVPDYFIDKSNEELVAFSKSNKDKIIDYHAKNYTHPQHGALGKHKFGKVYKQWPDFQFAMMGGVLLPRNWKDDPSYIDGDTMQMYNTVLKKVDKNKHFYAPVVAVDDVINITSSENKKKWKQNADGSYTISLGNLLSQLIRNDIYSEKAELFIKGLNHVTDHGGRWETYKLVEPTGSHADLGPKRKNIHPTYHPPANFNGIDTFEVVIGEQYRDKESKSKVTLTLGEGIEFKNPVANSDSFSVEQGKSKVVDVLGNDTHPEGKDLTLKSIEDVYNGEASISDDKVSYTAPSNYVGKTTFSYIVADSDGGTARGLVSVTVDKSSDYGGGTPPGEDPEDKPSVPVNPPPEDNAPVLAVDDFEWFLWSENTSENKVKINALKNDVGRKKRIISFTQPKHGRLEVKKNRKGHMKKFTYIQTDQNFIGKDHFTYTMRDRDGNEGTAVVTIEIQGTDNFNFPEGQ
jgi:hypothetical protein